MVRTRVLSSRCAPVVLCDHEIIAVTRPIGRELSWESLNMMGNGNAPVHWPRPKLASYGGAAREDCSWLQDSRDLPK